MLKTISSIEKVAAARIVVLFLLSVAISVPSRAQSKDPSFEVASVKVNPTPGRGTFHVGPDRLNLTRISLGSILIIAYGVRDFQIVAPDWVTNPNGSRFDIDAESSHPVPEDQLRLMLRPLLAERFHLTLHHEHKEMPAIAMQPARSGAKVTPSAGGVPPNTQWQGFAGVLFDGHKFMNAPMEALAVAVGVCTGGGLPPVIDQTGLKGRFDFAPPMPLPPQQPDAPAVTDEDRLAACDLNAQRDVGMTLKRTKAPVDILVIDHADKIPTEN